MRAALFGLALLAQGASAADGEARMAESFARLIDQPAQLTALVRAMPKGGDLHNHLTGAVYAENVIGWAAADGFCVDGNARLSPRPCLADQRPAADALQDNDLHHRMVNAYSMRNFTPADGESGHDHFFASFAKFGAVADRHDGDIIAEVANRAAAEHVAYVELMWSPGMGLARAAAADVAWDDDLAAMRDKLEPLMPAVLTEGRAHIADVLAHSQKVMRCGTADAQPGCAVTVRFLAQVIRTFPPAQVFAQILYGYQLVEADPVFVGMNIVAPEDHPIALADYHRHMRIFAALGAEHPSVKLSLHAGELALGLVPPEEMGFHIREAVELAKAKRIGHGVDIAEENGSANLLREMAAKKILVEINLTSNDGILGVSGENHPFSLYRRAGVPMALSTDDEGVNRSDLTREYVRAITTYRLGYREVKQLVRNSLEFAFLPEGEKAALKRKLEEDFRAFEAQ
jgi:adenosine deaminase